MPADRRPQPGARCCSECDRHLIHGARHSDRGLCATCGDAIRATPHRCVDCAAVLQARNPYTHCAACIERAQLDAHRLGRHYRPRRHIDRPVAPRRKPVAPRGPRNPSSTADAARALARRPLAWLSLLRVVGPAEIQRLRLRGWIEPLKQGGSVWRLSALGQEAIRCP